VTRSPLPAVIALGAISVWGCQSNHPSTETAAAAESPQAKPRAEQALLDDLAVANRILARELAILDVQGHVTARSRTNPNHYYMPASSRPAG
jgi:hypothetical protein